MGQQLKRSGTADPNKLDAQLIPGVVGFSSRESSNDPQNPGPVDLSVVVATPDGGSSLESCVASLTSQLTTTEAEILVVDGSTVGWTPSRLPGGPVTRLVRLPVGTEVARLWRAGIDSSRGRIIALLVDSCIPAPGWAKQVMRAHGGEFPVVGGAIDLGAQAGYVDSAVYFCRYSRYMPPFAPQCLEDLPGNNCSYKRAAIDGIRGEMADGFWETFIHRRMRSRGERLLCDPAILVRYVGPTRGWSFLRGRFIHGRNFAARQAHEMNRAQRILRALAFPVVPLIMLQRIAAQVWKKRRHGMRFLACTPLLTAFLVTWSTGEFFGYLWGPSKQIPRENRDESRIVREVG